MTEPPISQDDLDALAAALDGLNLPSGQRALLSGMISLAAERVVAAASDPVPSFREQFSTAFAPAGSNLLIGRSPNDIGRVTPGNVGRLPHPGGPGVGAAPDA